MIRFSPIASAVDDNKEEAVFFVKRADVGIVPTQETKTISQGTMPTSYRNDKQSRILSS